MEAARRAREITGRIKYRSLPIDVRRIATMHRCLVVRAPISGARGVTLFDRGHALIVLSSRSTPEQARWALAHELGHVLLNHDRRRAPRGDRSTCHEANVFASELLMPRRLVWRAWLDFEGDVDKLARLFGVTPAVMTERLEGLLGARSAPFDRTWVSIH